MQDLIDEILQVYKSQTEMKITNLLTIKLSNQLDLSKAKVEIYNALGELMDNVTQPNQQFNIVTKKWNTGVYFIHLLEDEKSIGQYKVVK